MARTKGQLTTADYLTVDDFNRFVDSLHNDGFYKWELFCRIAFCAGLRVSDVLSLKWKDILNVDIIGKLERKTQKGRQIKMNKSVKNKLYELYKLLGNPNIELPVICNPKTKKPYSREYINRQLKTFRVRYHLPIRAFSTHTFRKTFGRYVYESNGRNAESLILLNTIFRHSSIEVTKRYIGIRQDEIDRVFNSIKF
jgi:integrase